ncbi:choice-of-anchor A family protein [Nocardioides sp.]|uniref:choice-of-anchor A family protein n=1 Tax=Nocardioides sp. TaxID=35761 RepID=UPI00378331A7
MSGSLRSLRRRPTVFLVALACGLGSLAAVDLGAGPAGATVSCTTTSQPLGAATGWTEFVEGNGTRGSESEGAIAYGGNHTASGMTVGTRLPSGFPAASPGIVVAGTHGSYNLQRGSAYVSPKSGVNFNGGAGTGYLASNPIDFAAAFADLRSRSTTWGSATPNGTVVPGTTGGNAANVLTGTDPTLNVFTMTAAQLGSGKHIGIDVPAGSTVLVNVPDTTVSINGQMWIKSGGSFQQANDSVMESWPGVLWNFPNATSVTMGFSSAWGGSILAPNATLTIAQVGHTIGQMIAKSFSSNFETHQRLFPDSACLPSPPPPSGPSDVKITKTASTSSPHGGDAVTYTLKVQNVGLSPATGVVVTDPLPAGVTFDSASPGCSFASGTVTCAVGTLAVGGSVDLWVKVVANPVAGAGAASHPQAYHWLTPYKVEQQVDVEPGQTRSITVSCTGPGDILSDGSLRLDHVDQGTGALTDLRVLSSESTGLGTWKAVVQNPTSGRAQTKAFVVCLPAATEAADRQTGYADSHRHPLAADSALVTTTGAYGVGRQDATLTCPVGTVPVVPGFSLSGGAATLAASEHSAAAPRDWRFTLDVTSPTTATLSVRCLRTTVGAVYGHTHELRFTHVVQTVTVGAHTAAEGDEFQVICPDDAKGVVATWTVPPGVRHFGNDPRLKERAFRLFNDTGTAKTATVDLVCLHDRTGTEDMGTVSPVAIDNTAVVSSTSADANGTNNSSTATISVQPGTVTAGFAGTARVAGSRVTLAVVSSMPGDGRLSVRSGGTVLARGTVGLRPGGSAVAHLRATAAGARRLPTLDRVRVRVDPTRGRPVVRTVALTS